MAGIRNSAKRMSTSRSPEESRPLLVSQSSSLQTELRYLLNCSRTSSSLPHASTRPCGTHNHHRSTSQACGRSANPSCQDLAGRVSGLAACLSSPQTLFNPHKATALAAWRKSPYRQCSATAAAVTGNPRTRSTVDSALEICRQSRTIIWVNRGETHGPDRMNYAGPATKEGIVSEEECTHAGNDIEGKTDP